MHSFQQGNEYFIFSFDRTFNDKSNFFKPKFWQTQKRIIGTAKGRGTTYFLQTEDYLGVNCALRHYYRGGLWGKFNKDRYYFSSLKKTRSFAEFYLLQHLYEAGLPVPKPIAARVQKGKLGICYQADILTEKIENARNLSLLLQATPLPKEIWTQIGKLIRQQCWLLDFDKCTIRSGNSWKADNLNRLHRSFTKEIKRMKIQFTKQNWADLIAAYNQPQE